MYKEDRQTEKNQGLSLDASSAERSSEGCSRDEKTAR